MDSGLAPASWTWQKRRRLASIIVRDVMDPSNTIALGVSACSVFGIAFVEGWLRSVSGAKNRFLFCLSYAKSQLLPSIIWLTADPHDIAHKFVQNPDQIPQLVRQTLTPTLRRHVFFLQCLRSVIFGFVGIAQILRVVEIAATCEENYRQRVLRGSEPLMVVSGTTSISPTTQLPKGRQRVIRLAGRASDVTEYSLQKHGHHIIPIYEDVDVAAPVMAEYSKNGSFPLGWIVRNKQYGHRSAWEGFVPDKSWLFPVRKKKKQEEVTPHHEGNNDNQHSTTAPTTNKNHNDENKELLIIEADSSVGEQSLALDAESANDLDLAEASMAFSQIGLLALERGVIQEVPSLASPPY